MNNVLMLQTTKYEIKIENFEGPLDLLCHLIEKNKMDIYEVKLSEITDQYIEYLNEAEKLNMEVASEFLVIASTLLYIKSKSLLPNPEDEEEELTEEELKLKIIEYKKYKEFTNVLKNRYQEFFGSIFKSTDTIELPKQELEIINNKEIIPKMYKELIERNETKLNLNAGNIEKIAINESVSVASKVKDIFRELLKAPKFILNKLFKNNNYNKVEIVTSFIGVLELTRKNKVTTSQEELFGDIVVEKTKK